MNRIASLKLTAFALVALAAGVAQYSLSGRTSVAWVVAPLVALALNLGVSLLVHPAFRRNLPLLAFHVSLLAILALAAVGRLTYFKGRLELSEGEMFDGHVSESDAGAFHAGRLDRVRFVNDGFAIRYAAGLRREETRNRLRVVQPDGSERVQVIGDNEPLIAEGYRFYTTPNKGYSLLFRWQPARGPAQRGAVNLPSYPAREHEQAMEWTLPGTARSVWTALELDAPPLDAQRETWFRLPATHKIVVRAGERRSELAPGGHVAMADGVLVYEGLGTWMGYQVFYDWTVPWLLSACLTAVASLAWHFARRFAAVRWDA